MPGWMTLSAARDYIESIVGDRTTAEAELLHELRRGRLASVAGHLEEGRGSIRGEIDHRLNQPLGHWLKGGSFWERATVDFDASSAVIGLYDQHADPFGRGLWEGPDGQVQAVAIEVDREKVQSIWGPPSSQVGKTKGRPPGRSLDSADAPLVKEMRALLPPNGTLASPSEAARIVAGEDGSRAGGAGTPESKIRRLVRRYNDGA